MRGKQARKRYQQGFVGDLAERKAAAEKAIRDAGYTLHYVEWCEDSETPGILGYYGGITDHKRRKVKIRTHDRSERELLVTVEHEARHVLHPEWDCGNRLPFGDKRPMKSTSEWREWIKTRAAEVSEDV